MVTGPVTIAITCFVQSLDGIIVGGSSSEYILQNIDACDEGPLDSSD